MYNVFKMTYTAATATETAARVLTTVPFPSTELLRYLDSIGVASDTLMVVDHSFDKDARENGELQQMLNADAEHGVMINGLVYEPLMAGASQMREAKSLWCNREFTPLIRKWFSLNVNTHAMSPNKAAKYAALTMSSSMPWGEAFPDDGLYGLYEQIDIDRVAVFKDVENEVSGVFDRVFPDEVESDVPMSVEAKFTDGMSLYVVDDSHLTPNQRQRVVERMEAFTFRAPWFKGLAVPVLKSALCQWFLDHDKSMLIKDFWGNTVNLRDLQLISFGTTFKAAKAVQSWESFKAAFKQYGREFSVCVLAHSRKLDVPYQQMQTIEFSPEEIRAIVDRHTEMMSEYTKPENAPKLLSGNMGKVVALMPELMNFWFIRQQMQTAYANKRRKVLGGRYMLASYNPFAAPDPVAVLEHLSGMTVSGQIAPKQVSCRLFGEKRVDVTRCPHLDHAHAVRDNIRVKAYDGLYLGHTCFFAVGDATMPLLQMDYDGDHVNVTDDKLIVNAALRTSAYVYHNRPLTYPAMDAVGGKSETKYFKRMIPNIKSAPVGLYANALTKIWAGREPGYKGFNKIRNDVDFLTRRANTCIDAATHGDDKSSGRAEELTKKLAKTPMPMFHKYAKGKLDKNGIDVIPQNGKDSYQYYETSSLDTMCRQLEENLSAVLRVSGYDGDMLPRMTKDQMAVMMVRTAKNNRIKDLIHDSNKRTGEEEGLFNRIAKRRVEEWSKLNANNALEHVAEFDSGVASTAIKEIEAHAAKYGYTLDDAYNSIVNELFVTRGYKLDKPEDNQRFLPQLLRTFWVIFGEKALDTVLDNLEHDGANMEKADLADDDYEAAFDVIDSDESFFD